MASVVGLLEERELAARRRVEGLREEADRVLAALAEAETHWQEWVIARQRVGEVLSVPRIREADPVPAEEPSVPEREPEPVADAPPRGVCPWSCAGGFHRPGMAARLILQQYHDDDVGSPHLATGGREQARHERADPRRLDGLSGTRAAR